MGAVGMTYEQGDVVPYPKRVRHQYTSALTTLYAGATHRASILRQWRGTFVQAKEERHCRWRRTGSTTPATSF